MKARKGTSTDSIVVIVMLFCVALTLLLVGALYAPLATSLQGVLSSEGNDSLARTTNAMDTRDMFFMIVWFGAAFVSLISAFLVKTHPAYLGIALLFYIPMLLLGPLFSNMYEQLTNSTDITSQTASMPKTDWFMDHLYMFNFGFSMLLIMVLYINFRSGD